MIPKGARVRILVPNFLGQFAEVVDHEQYPDNINWDHVVAVQVREDDYEYCYFAESELEVIP